MSALRQTLHGGAEPSGGVWRYPVERLYEEVAYLAYHFHWPHDEILHLEHRERARWVEEVVKINRRVNDDSGE